MMTDDARADVPVACTLGPDDLRSRQHELRGLLGRAVRRVERLEDGVAFTLDGSAGTLGALAHLMVLERECCRFLRFALDAEPDLGDVRFTVTGPPGSGATIHALFAMEPAAAPDEASRGG